MLPFMREFAVQLRGSARILSAIIVSSLPAAAQPATSSVDSMIVQARGEIRDFEKAGGKKDDTNHPVKKWVQALWTLYEQPPRTPETARAASEAVHLLIHADRFLEAYAWADRVPPDDPAWEGISEVLVEATSLQKSFTYFFQKLPSVLSSSTNVTVRAAVQWSLGRVWLSQKEAGKAKAAFEAAIELAADSAPGRQAERQLYEMLHLGPGQPAPLFSATATDGSRISLADYRGKPVAIVFWSST